MYEQLADQRTGAHAPKITDNVDSDFFVWSEKKIYQRFEIETDAFAQKQNKYCYLRDGSQNSKNQKRSDFQIFLKIVDFFHLLWEHYCHPFQLNVYSWLSLNRIPLIFEWIRSDCPIPLLLKLALYNLNSFNSKTVFSQTNSLAKASP